jgi:hypothetical protein
MNEVVYPPCVQCGYCCTVGPCPYGLWDHERKQCQWLNDPNELGQRTCAKYYKINVPGSFMAFGDGCSSTLCNTQRNKIVKKLAESKKVDQRTEL